MSLFAAIAVLATACSQDDPEPAALEPRIYDNAMQEAVRTGGLSGEFDIVIPRKVGDQPPFEYFDYGVERFGSVQVSDGIALLMDGIAVTVDPHASALQLPDPDNPDGYLTGNEVTELHFGVDTLEISLLNGPIETEGILVHARPLDSIAEWGPFELAYGTDGGLGGLISWAVVEASKNQRLISEEQFVNEIQTSRQWLGDLADEPPGNDTLVFSNGFGDAWFPLSPAYDANGDLVAVAIWAYPFFEHWEPDLG